MGILLALSTKEIEKLCLVGWAMDKSGKAINKKNAEAVSQIDLSSFLMLI